MYGTIAQMKIKPGTEEQFKKLADEQGASEIPGFVFQHVYRSDSDPNEVFLAVGFENKDAYVANAKSPEQHVRYEQYRALMASEPEWHDGEIVFSATS
jgi:heme-degrading monooxygenase HmoA